MSWQPDVIVNKFKCKEPTNDSNRDHTVHFAFAYPVAQPQIDTTTGLLQWTTKTHDRSTWLINCDYSVPPSRVFLMIVTKKRQNSLSILTRLSVMRTKIRKMSGSEKLIVQPSWLKRQGPGAEIFKFPLHPGCWYPQLGWLLLKLFQATNKKSRSKCFGSGNN